MIENNKIDRLFQLILLLSDGRGYTLKEIADRLNVSLRSVYRYMDFFENSPFTLHEKDGSFFLDRASMFFREMNEVQNFTTEECILMKLALAKYPEQTGKVKQLQKKITHLFQLDELQTISTGQFIKNQELLQRASAEKLQVVLKNYHSNNSSTVSDRIVEPFAMLAGNTEIRAFEISSQTNKTYKISRIEDVAIMPVYWEFDKLHKMAFTDAFHFNGEELIPVTLRLDKMAATLLQEEVMVRVGELEQEDDTHWIYTTNVCAYQGIGRFIKGLVGHIQILKGKGLKAYLKSDMKEGMKKL